MAVVKHEEILPKTSEVNAQTPGNELCRSGWMLTRELCIVPENLVFALAGESTSVCFIFPRVPRVGSHLGFSGTQLSQQILPTPGPPLSHSCDKHLVSPTGASFAATVLSDWLFFTRMHEGEMSPVCPHTETHSSPLTAL